MLFSRPHFTDQAPKSVLILRFSSIGDVLLTTPAIEALARTWPKTRIFFATKNEMAPLLAHNPYIEKVLALGPKESLFAFARRLAKLQPTVILDLHNKLRSKALRLVVPSVPGVVWKNRTLWDYCLLPLALKNYHSRVLFADRYHRATERLTGKNLERGLLRYFPSQAEKQEAKEKLKELGLNLKKPLVGIAVGTRWETKRWPLDYFTELTAKAKQAKLQILLTGNAQDKALTRRVQIQVSDIPDICGQSLRFTAAAISLCNAFVSNDSGPMHIARALGVPTLAIFGSTDPKMFNFQGHKLVYGGQPCSPCGFNGRAACPLKHFRCMQEIYPQQVWVALQALLEGEARKPYLHG